MTADWLLENLIAWSAQVCVMVAVAAGATLALKTPRARLWFWQAILLLALLLPFVQPRVTPHAASGQVSISTGPGVVANDAPSHSIAICRPRNLLLAITLGIALRLIWIAIGFARLRRHRLDANIFTDPPVASSRVRWYRSQTVSGPVTYGWLRPVILLPSRVDALDPAQREAICRHELIHVERGDWLFVIAEELIRATLWFHPGVWFVLGQIQLAREQTVDAEVVGQTRDREQYLNALLAVAEQKFFPAPLFLKKRQLAVRVAAVLKETNMSRSRMIPRFATVSFAALLAARVAMWFFPMQSPAQTPAEAVPGDDPRMTLDAGAPLLHRPPVFRGLGVVAAGTVLVDATVDQNGEVGDARVVSGPEPLRKPVLQSVLQWHYSNDPAPPATVRIVVDFGPLASVPPKNIELPPPPVSSQSFATLKSIQFANVSAELAKKARDAPPVREGDQVSTASREQILAAARRVDEHFNGRLYLAPNGEATLTLGLGDSLPIRVPAITTRAAANPQNGPSQSVMITAAAPPGVTPTSTSTPPRIHVDGNVQAANLVKRVVPVYPPDAKRAGVQGIVMLEATIGKTGRVVDVHVVSGPELLAGPAEQAVMHWEYQPTLLNGQPVEVVTQIEVNFTLSQ
jgi:TonB family protein